MYCTCSRACPTALNHVGTMFHCLLKCPVPCPDHAPLHSPVPFTMSLPCSPACLTAPHHVLTMFPYHPPCPLPCPYHVPLPAPAPLTMSLPCSLACPAAPHHVFTMFHWLLLAPLTMSVSMFPSLSQCPLTGPYHAPLLAPVPLTMSLPYSIGCPGARDHVLGLSEYCGAPDHVLTMLPCLPQCPLPIPEHAPLPDPVVISMSLPCSAARPSAPYHVLTTFPSPSWCLHTAFFRLMQCHCFLPGCLVCFPTSNREPVSPQDRPRCCCLLPDCAVCSSESSGTPDLGTSISGKGHVLPPEAAAVVASVDKKLREILDGDGDNAHGYLARGKAYKALPTKSDYGGGFDCGTRHDHLVAYLCSVGVHTVRRSRQRMKECESDQQHILASCPASERTARALLPKAAAVRGVKPVLFAGVQSSDKSHVLASTQDQLDASDLKPAGQQVLASVPGHYLACSPQNAQNHAIALVLGRLYAMAMVDGLPDTVVQKIVVLLDMAGVKVGAKHHTRQVISAYGGILSRLCVEANRETFWEKPSTLLFPSAWRVVFDGVTLANGATVTMVLVVFTNKEGKIAVHFLGCCRCGKTSTGEDVATGVMQLLERTLHITQRVSRCLSSRGLPLAVAAGSSPVRR